MNLHQYYSNYNEGERLLKTRSRQMEYLSTIKALSAFLTNKSEVIELGAGEGVYIDHISLKCKTYYATDVVDKHITEMKVKAKDKNNVIVQYANAVDMSSYSESKFDIVLCLGPYYHLNNEENRHKCIMECKRICKNNGYIAISYINKMFVNLIYLQYGINFNTNEYECLINGENRQLGYKDKFLKISYFNTPEEIESEVKKEGLEIIDHLRTDGPYSILDEKLEKLSCNDFESIMEFHYKTCRERSVLGMSNHGLIICKNRKL